MEYDRALRMEIINGYLSETQERFEHINKTYFDNDIPDIMLRISDRLSSRIGYAHSNPLGVVLSYRYLDKYGWDVLDEVLRHEIAHIYAYHFHGERGHRGAHFRNACKLMDVSPTARTNDLFVEREKWHYRCRICGTVYSTYRPFTSVQHCDCSAKSDGTILVKATREQIVLPLVEFRKHIRPKITVYRCASCGREVHRYKRWSEKHSCAICHPNEYDESCLMELVR
ncbi:MAG TPA: SprT-like domain-containing protein [Methanocella sp.]|nr:SprT-like domain-containing protein [Methanocella sp.]